MKHSDIFDSNYYFDKTSSTGVRYINDYKAGKCPHKAGDEAGTFRQSKNPNVRSLGSLQTSRTIDGVKTSIQWHLPRIIFEHYNDCELANYEIIDYIDGNSTNLNPDNLFISRKTFRKRTNKSHTKSGFYSIRKRIDVSFKTEEEASTFSKEFEEFLKSKLIKTEV